MRRGLLIAVGTLVALLAVAAALQLVRPVPVPRTVFSLPSSYTVPGPALQLPFPTAGQASLYLDGTGWVARTPGQTPVAIASVTKLMTALLVVRAHPLNPGQPGPSLTLSAADQSVYQQELAAGDSVVAVRAGESISELQLLEGLLLPSGDNVARLLSQWVSGSRGAFVVAMNQEAKRLGMTQTVYADASGLDPGSMSTATDLTKLAMKVMAQPVLADVVAMSTAVLPVAGTVHNYDFVLGRQGVVGIKTGWTAEAGGCFVFAARRPVGGGHTAELLGAVLAQPGNAYSGIAAAEHDSVALLAATWPRLEVVAPIQAGEVVGQLRTPWGARSPVRAVGTIRVLGWPGLAIPLTARAMPLRTPLDKGAVVGELRARPAGGPDLSAAALAGSQLNGPGWYWRLSDRNL